MSRWWLQHWTAVEMTWRWLVPPFLTHPLHLRVCPALENLLENVKIWHWKNYFLEEVELKDVRSWQQHGSVMLLNLVALIYHLLLSSVRIWQGMIVFPLKFIQKYTRKNKRLPYCGVIKSSQLWSSAKQIFLNPNGFLCVFNTKFIYTNKNLLVSLPSSLQTCLHELKKQFSDSHRVKRLSGMRLEALER